MHPRARSRRRLPRRSPQTTAPSTTDDPSTMATTPAAGYLLPCRRRPRAAAEAAGGAAVAGGCVVAGGRVVAWRRRPGRGGEGHHPVGRGHQQQPVTHAGRGEVVGRRTDGGLLAHRPGGRVQSVQHPVLSDRPHQSGGDDREDRPLVRSATGHRSTRARCTRPPPWCRRGTAGRRWRPSSPRHRPCRRCTATAPTPAGPRCPRGGLRPHVGDAGLAGHQHLPVRQQRRLHRHVEVPGVVRGPRRRGEVLLQAERGGELEHRVAVVVGVRRRRDRAVPRLDPDVARRIDGGGSPAHPHRTLRLTGSGVDGEDGGVPPDSGTVTTRPR